MKKLVDFLLKRFFNFINLWLFIILI